MNFMNPVALRPYRLIFLFLSSWNYKMWDFGRSAGRVYIIALMRRYLIPYKHAWLTLKLSIFIKLVNPPKGGTLSLLFERNPRK
jgi:hypothetical protein